VAVDRPFFTEEWTTFTRYARRIHSFTLIGFELEMSDVAIWQALVSTSSSPLLPNIRRLEWLDGRDSFFPLLHALFVPTITSIRLGSALCWWYPSSAKSALLASLGARCPTIRELDCVYRGDNQDSSDALSEAVCGCRKLVRLNTGVLNAQALAHLASLPSLRSLHFRLPYRAVDHLDTPPNSIPIFPFKLDELSIDALSHSHLTQCFRNIRFLSCRSVVLFIDCDELGKPYDPLDIPGLVVSFSECFSPILEQLRVEISVGWDDDDDDDDYQNILDNRRFAFGFNVISPLLPFSRLTKLDLSWFCTSNVDDGGLKHMAQSWPELEEFSLGTLERWVVPPSITFTGLVYLIQHCRHLQLIRIHFSACPIDTDSEPFSTTSPNQMITSMFVGLSPIVDPMTVASQLHTLLPNLTDVIRHDWDEVFGPVSPFKGEWNSMDVYLRAFIKGVDSRQEICGLSEEVSSS
jgi:hypothetical protein